MWSGYFFSFRPRKSNRPPVLKSKANLQKTAGYHRGVYWVLPLTRDLTRATGGAPAGVFRISFARQGGSEFLPPFPLSTVVLSRKVECDIGWRLKQISDNRPWRAANLR